MAQNIILWNYIPQNSSNYSIEQFNGVSVNDTWLHWVTLSFRSSTAIFYLVYVFLRCFLKLKAISFCFIYVEAFQLHAYVFMVFFLLYQHIMLIFILSNISCSEACLIFIQPFELPFAQCFHSMSFSTFFLTFYT